MVIDLCLSFHSKRNTAQQKGACLLLFIAKVEEKSIK